MSYILDALRRADAERQQGQVPGLHATPASDLPRTTQRAWAPWSRPLLLALLAALLLAAAAAVWLQFGRTQPTRLEPLAQASPAAAPAMPPAALGPPVQSGQPGPQGNQGNPANRVPIPALPIVVSAAPVLPAIPASSAAAPPVKPVEAAAAVPAGAAPKAAVTAVMRAVPLSSLPADERRQLPALVPGGSVWSDSAASRFVILDGQVLREGDALSTGLVLERIERKAAVLRWKDLRVEVPL